MNMTTTANANVTDHEFNTSTSLMQQVEIYTVPIIGVLGLIGNSLSVAVFLQRSMRKRSCSLFLAARGISDSGFLSAVLIMWTSSVFELQQSTIMGLCQIIVFLTYVFGCQSVWLVVFVTAENYFRVCRPFMVSEICKPVNAKAAMLVSFIFITACYKTPLWTMSVDCMPYNKHMSFISVMMFFDTVVTLIVPTILKLGLMAAISLSLCKRQRRMSTVYSTSKGFRPYRNVTTMLLAVTLLFFVLNMPLHAVRLRLMILALIKDTADITTAVDLTLRSFCQLLYYASMSVNMIIYYMLGTKFRETCHSLFNRSRSHIYTQANQGECLNSIEE